MINENENENENESSPWKNGNGFNWDQGKKQKRKGDGTDVWKYCSIYIHKWVLISHFLSIFYQYVFVVRMTVSVLIVHAMNNGIFYIYLFIFKKDLELTLM